MDRIIGLAALSMLPAAVVTALLVAPGASFAASPTQSPTQAASPASVASDQAGSGRTMFGDVEFGVFAGWTGLSPDNQLGNSPHPQMRPGSGVTFGGRGSTYLSTSIAVEAEVDYTLSSFLDSGLAAGILGWRGLALWHFARWNVGGGLRPFVALGVGSEFITYQEYGSELDGDVSGHAGLGVKFGLFDRLGVRFDLRYVAMDGATAVIAHSWKALLQFTLRPDTSARDRDGDGLLDAVDTCPDEPEDKDGFKDEDGCPDPDNDGDGVLDGADQCTVTVEDKDGFRDDDGCPDPDNDGDGLLDVNDKCPDAAEDKDGFKDEDGCPDLDNDGDGLPDKDDKCPNKIGEARDGGCPPGDRDGDGIPDRVDKCPDKAETFNGKQDEDGCPDGKETVAFNRGALIIKQKVYFAIGKAALAVRSHALLNTVAAVLKTRPRLTKVIVEGHTDDLGAAEQNQLLSQQRAEAVVAWLVKRGVAKTRLVAKGLGASEPLCVDVAALNQHPARNKRKIAACRERNRRVQFTVAERDGRAMKADDKVSAH